MHISRIIHQTAPNLSSLPAEIRANVEHLKALNPGWDYRFYDHGEALDYIGEHLGQDALRLCEAVDPRFGVIIADLFRYVAIHREGGIYLDIKSTARAPFDEILLPDDVYLLSQWRNRLGERYQGWGMMRELANLPGGELQQWHVIGAAGHPFLEQVIADTLRNMAQYHPVSFGRGKRAVEIVSGPICYTRAIIRLLPHFSARIVDIESCGIEYTIYEDRNHHMGRAEHYSKIKAPIMRSGAPDPAIPAIFRRQG